MIEVRVDEWMSDPFIIYPRGGRAWWSSISRERDKGNVRGRVVVIVESSRAILAPVVADKQKKVPLCYIQRWYVVDHEQVNAAVLLCVSPDH